MILENQAPHSPRGNSTPLHSTLILINIKSIIKFLFYHLHSNLLIILLTIISRGIIPETELPHLPQENVLALPCLFSLITRERERERERERPGYTCHQGHDGHSGTQMGVYTEGTLLSLYKRPIEGCMSHYAKQTIEKKTP